MELLSDDRKRKEAGERKNNMMFSVTSGLEIMET